MDCGTAQFLIEALCDDEIRIADAAMLLAHLEVCVVCRYRRRVVQDRRAFVQRNRPVDRCPEEIRRRLRERCAFTLRRAGD